MRLASVAAVSIGMLAACGDGLAGNGTIRLEGSTMGTTYEVQLPCVPHGVAAEQVRTGVERILTAIEDRMSTYRPASEVSRFNRARTIEWFTVSPDTRRVVTEALRIGRLSAGAFDVSVAPIVDLWGFGAGSSKRAVPPDEAIDTRLARVGPSMLRARSQPAAIRKHRADVQIDLSALAKGFAVDKLADYLLMQEIDDFLVEIGGEIRAGGHNASGEPWKVAIKGPTGDPYTAEAIVTLVDASVATSGDYHNFFQREGRRYSHVIDPRSGRPIAHRLVSVAVIDRSAMRADGLATALLVLGPEQGPRLADREGLAALFITARAGTISGTSTPEFERYMLH